MNKPLEDSIEHWQRLEKYYLEENYKALQEEGWSMGSCALCVAHFRDSTSTIICRTCPIACRTGLNDCRGTPYGEAANALGDAGDFNVIERYSKQGALSISAEIEFLKSLREVIK